MQRGLTARAKTTCLASAHPRPASCGQPSKKLKMRLLCRQAAPFHYQQQLAAHEPVCTAAPDNEEEKQGRKAESATGFYMGAIV
jgi:hypothetical protein